MNLPGASNEHDGTTGSVGHRAGADTCRTGGIGEDAPAGVQGAGREPGACRRDSSWRCWGRRCISRCWAWRRCTGWSPTFDVISFGDALEHECLALRNAEGQLLVVFGDPFDTRLQAWVEEHVQQHFEWYLAHSVRHRGLPDAARGKHARDGQRDRQQRQHRAQRPARRRSVAEEHRRRDQHRGQAGALDPVRRAEPGSQRHPPGDRAHRASSSNTASTACSTP